MDPLTLAAGAFIVTSIGAGISENRFYRALADDSNAVSSNAQFLRQFREDPRQMPGANVKETRRRLQALVSRQADQHLEKLRRTALLWTILSGAMFLGTALVVVRPS